MIKVLHMTPPIVNNGVYNYIFSNLHHIDKSKYEFAFLTQAKNELKNTDEYKKYGFKIHNFTTTQRENPEKFRKEIVDILSMGYDVIHLHTSFWRGFLIEEIAMELGIPKVIVHSHSSDIDIADEQKRKKMYEEHLYFKSKFNASYATHFWACSQMAADWLYGEQIPKKDIQIIKNAIEAEKYRFNEDTRNLYRNMLGLNGKFVIGNTCRFEYQKNHEFLVKVFVQVHRRNPNTVLLLVGGGKNLPIIKKMVKEYEIEDSVIFLGWRNDIAQILQAIDLYCLPSRFEGLPIVLVEAQSAGLACLSGNNITQEAKIIDSVRYIELKQEDWVSQIEYWINGYDREDTFEQIKQAGFDIKQQVKVIEEAYAK